MPVCLTGVAPWRPAQLLAARTYAELTVPPPGFPERQAMWRAAFPLLDRDTVADYAARYRMTGGELRVTYKTLEQLDEIVRRLGRT